MKKRLFFAIVILLLVFAVAACDVTVHTREAEVKSIAVDNVYKIGGYVQGDRLNIENAVLIVTYYDGQIETIDLTEDMLSGYDMNVVEENKVITVTYGGATTSFTVSVAPLQFDEVTIASVPYKTVYVEGEQVDTTGATLLIKYDGGKTYTTNIDEKMLADYDNTKIGKQNIYVPYNGENLFFVVEFIEKTVTGISVMREPTQTSVFKNYNQNPNADTAAQLTLDGMKLRVYYDNGMSPETEYAEVKDSIVYYVDNSEAGSTTAKLAYLPKDYPTEYAYNYTGNARVGTGDYVTPKTELATNTNLADTVSKSYGMVTSTVNGTVVVSTIVTYDVSEIFCKKGDIVFSDESLGRRAGNNVFPLGGGGVVLEAGGGKVTVQTAPVSSFNINVKERSYQSMEILRYPVTQLNASDRLNIIQGDTLNLSTGMVRVYFDNGEHIDYEMTSSLIKVINGDGDNLLNEIPDLKFTGTDDVKNLPAEQYELKYGLVHNYDESQVRLNVSVLDGNGNNLFVRDNRWVSLGEGKNYTVSITVTVNVNGRDLQSQCVYYLSTVGAGARHDELNISTPGQHNLWVYYGGIRADGITMPVRVLSRYPVRLNIMADKDVITGRTYEKGDTIPISTMEYTITYNNGDTSENIGLTLDMLTEGSTLYCSALGPKTVSFTIPNAEYVEPVRLTCNVKAATIATVAWSKEPMDTFMAFEASNSTPINIAGGVLRVRYRNEQIKIIGDEASGVSIQSLVGNPFGQRIEIEYPDVNDQKKLTPDEIYNDGKYYVARLTYYDEDGESASCDVKFYVIEKVIKSISVNTRQEYFKSSYIQCEDWDLSGIFITVQYENGSSELPIQATPNMIYDSTTDVVGNDIPVKFTYLGKTNDNSVKINVGRRLETGIKVEQTGKDAYRTTERTVDLSDFRFSIAYNAGLPVTVYGIVDFAGSQYTEGWWYEIFEKDALGNEIRGSLNREGEKTVRLSHTTVTYDESGRARYTYVSTDISITVTESELSITKITYDDDGLGTHDGKPVLSITARGWELFLSEYDEKSGKIVPKYVTVHYENGEVGYVELTNDMLSYNTGETTLGYRPVTIRYKSVYTAEVFVYVVYSTSMRIAVEKEPCVNYIAGSALDLEGGIISCIFEYYEGGARRELKKHVVMTADGVKVTGYNNNIGDLDKQGETLTVTYRECQTNFSITVFNRQILTFQYQNTIFFYGNVKEATYTAIQLIPEFAVPNSEQLKLWYACSVDFIEEADIYAYIEANGGAITDFMKILMNDGVTYNYVPRNNMRAAGNRYIEPAPVGYDYYIIMEVSGNDYYKEENYCYQKYTIISKVISVTAEKPTELAYIRKYTAASRVSSTAIDFLYDNLAGLVNSLTGGIISEVALLSPNANGFEIGVYVTTAFDENKAEDIKRLNDIFTAVENELIKVQNLAMTAGKVRKGINVGNYYGDAPEFITYRINRGETLRLGGVLELLSGKLALTADYDHGTGTYAITVGSLGHKNYNIDFMSATFEVRAQEITECIFTGNWNESERVLNISRGGRINMVIRYDEADAYGTVEARTRTIDEGELKFYDDSGEPLESITEIGTYYVKVATPNSFTMGGEAVDLNFTLIVSE